MLNKTKHVIKYLNNKVIKKKSIDFWRSKMIKTDYSNANQNLTFKRNVKVISLYLFLI